VKSPATAAIKEDTRKIQAEEIVAAATRLIADVRARCAALGLTPRQFADLLLPEALLAMMIDGMRQGEVETAFAAFAHNEISLWFERVRRAGGCDCEREMLNDRFEVRNGRLMKRESRNRPLMMCYASN
jgi:hypothetical protein